MHMPLRLRNVTMVTSVVKLPHDQIPTYYCTRVARVHACTRQVSNQITHHLVTHVMMMYPGSLFACHESAMISVLVQFNCSIHVRVDRDRTKSSFHHCSQHVCTPAFLALEKENVFLLPACACAIVCAGRFSCVTS